MVRRPLVISTPDGSGQPFHPDVVDSGSSFAGHRFWLACTPYPYGNDQLENPVIRVSGDGMHWSVPAGIADPLVAAPTDSSRHWSDTDLVLHDGMLHLFFRGCARGSAQAEILLMTSTDGIGWSMPETVHTGAWLLSPAVVCEPGGWSMWHVWCDGSAAQLLRQQSGDARSWQAAEPCGLTIAGYELWHIDVITVVSGYEALICAFPTGTDSSRCRLFHAHSSDGLAFTLTDPAPIMKPSRFGWSNRLIYRSTFVKRDDGTYRIWYSAASWGMRCGIGLVEGPLVDLVSVTASTYRPAALAGVREDIIGIATYLELRRKLLGVPARLRQLVGR